jgi:catechol 2,3-dioxygenase-like lactoylglutathione lyase family enzyme
MAEINLDDIKAERARLEATYITADRPATSARGIHHAALICSSVVTQEKWEHLRGNLDAAGVEYQVASGTSIYFKDPDGVRLELLADPLGEMYGTKVLL